jgi:predicted transcriptional regulator
VFRIQPRPTEQLSVRVLPEVIAEIDRMASRLKTTRSAVARALIDSGLEQLRYFQQEEES